MEHDFQETVLGGYRLMVDVERTRAYYAAQPPYDCPCAGCRNFVRAVKLLPGEVKALFDALGLDPAKPEEVCSYPGTREEAHGGAWYHICGTILEGGTPPEGRRFSEWVPVAERFEAAFTDDYSLPAEDFPRPVFQMDTDFWLPWVLEEENPDGP